MKSKDILFMCQFFYPEYISSATLPFDTAQYLSKSGYKVGVLCGYPKEYSMAEKVPERENIGGIEIHRINYIQLGREKVIGRIVNYFSLVVAMFMHMKEAKNYKTIIIYSNPPLLPLVAMVCKKLYKCKIVFVSYDVYPEIAISTEMISEQGVTAKFFRKMNEKFFKKVDKIVAISSDMKDFFINRRNTNKEKIVVIPNWYEDCLDKKEVQSNISSEWLDSTFVISYLGNLGTCQDGDILVELSKVLKDKKDILLVVAGHGNKMEELKDNIVKEKLENIIVLPFLHGDDYEAVLKRSDMFIVTLRSGLTGLCSPSKICAYLMSGKPVIAAMDKEMEIAEDIERYEAGFVLDEKDCQKTGELISGLVKDKNQMVYMGENARKLFIDKYEKEICLKQYKEMFETITE